MSGNLPAIRQEIAEAQARGDRAAADRAYSLELQALAAGQGRDTGVPAATGRSAGGDLAERVYGAIEADHGAAAADDLRLAWGSQAVDNIKIASAVFSDFSSTIAAIQEQGTLDHPDVLIAVVRDARGLGYAVEHSGAQSAPAPRAASSAPARSKHDDDALEAIREQINAAQAEGKTAKAQRLYQEEMALVAARHGNRRIVDGRRTA